MVKSAKTVLKKTSKEAQFIQLLTSTDGEFYTYEEIMEKTKLSKNSLDFYLKRNYLSKVKKMNCNVLVGQKNGQIAYRLEITN